MKKKEEAVPYKTVVPYNSEKKYEEVKIGDILIRLIPIDELEIAQNNIRVFYREGDLEDLSKNIEQLGLLHLPLATSDGKVYVGGRRLQAYKKAGKLVMPVRILDVPEKEQILLSMSENLNIDPLSSQDLINKAEILINKYGMTYKDIATRLGKDPGTFSLYFAYQRLPEETEEEVRKIVRDEVGPRKAQGINRFFNTPLMQKNFDKQGEMIYYLKQLPADYLDSYIIQANLNLPVLNQIREVAVYPHYYKRLLVPLREGTYEEMVQYTQEKHMTFSALITNAIRDYIERNPIPKIGPLEYHYSDDS